MRRSDRAGCSWHNMNCVGSWLHECREFQRAVPASRKILQYRKDPTISKLTNELKASVNNYCKKTKHSGAVS